MLKPTKILVPTDFSNYSRTALKQAIDIATEYSAEIHVLHVIEDKIHSFYDDELTGQTTSRETIRRIEKKEIKAAEEIMRRHLEKNVNNNTVKVFSKVIKGVPTTEILNFQRKNKIDLLVISSLGHGGLAEYFIGSVARNVLKGSTCPVLLTKT